MITIITDGETEKWNSIVKSFQDYDVNYLNQYSKAFKGAGSGEPILLYFQNNNTRAINVIMKRDIALHNKFKGKIQSGKFYDISTPYGYGGFWVEGSDFKTIEKEYISYCNDNQYISEFVRFHLYSPYRNYFNGNIESPVNNVVRSLNLNIDEMRMDFEHKVRKNIRKAKDAGLNIYFDYKGDKTNEFIKIYRETMSRNNADENFLFHNSFFEDINKMMDNYVYVHVCFNNEIISSELVLYDKTNCYSFLGGTKSKYFNIRPNDFLKFEIIKWAKDKGLQRFILGGGYGADDGIFRYKKSFAPNGIQKFYIGKRVFNNERYRLLIDIRGKERGFEKTSSFFPIYRA